MMIAFEMGFIIALQLMGFNKSVFGYIVGIKFKPIITLARNIETNKVHNPQTGPPSWPVFPLLNPT